MIIEHHDKEAALLRRRLEFLEIMNGWLRADIGLEGPKDGPSKVIENQFRSVRNPSDVLTSYQKIYGKKLP